MDKQLIIPARRAGLLALALGCVAALDYARLGLTLTHYDARGHLVVARRIIDSLTPGWQQIGAVWLPLPHLLNLLPVQVDAFYRTGISGVAFSVASFGVATASIAWLLMYLTGSPMAAAVGAAAFALNPSVLYLQATPMTEPLLLGLMLAALAGLAAWSGPPARRPSAAAVGWMLVLASLTRYEAWPVVASGLVGAVWARWRQGETINRLLRDTTRISLYPAAALAGFALFSRVVVGRWFVSNDFFVPENEALGKPLLALAQIVWGVRALSSQTLVIVGGAGLAILLARSLVVRRDAHSAIVVAAAATAAVPWVAFLDGHPYRIRYMVPLIAAEALGIGVFLASVQRMLHERVAAIRASNGPWSRFAGAIEGGVVAALTAGLIVSAPSPFDHHAPMVMEAQWDRPNIAARRAVTACLLRDYRGETIMASMGSLGHYMQELSGSGLGIRNFLHEGNGDIWLTALDSPRAYAGWILMEEKAEGGDMLAHLAQKRPAFLAGFTRTCEAAGVALYRRDPADAVPQARVTNDAR